MQSKHLFTFVALLGAAATLSASAEADLSDRQAPNTEASLPLAVEGLDVTTYFTEGGPEVGKKSITMEWNGKKWRFISKANMRQFAKNPMRYAPRYGGNCCQSLAEGKVRKGDPRVFRIVDGRLYFFHDADRKRMWTEELPESRSRSEDHYLRLFSRDF